MEDGATFGSPNNGASPNGNPILAQPPLEGDNTDGAGQGTVSLVAPADGDTLSN